MAADSPGAGKAFVATATPEHWQRKGAFVNAEGVAMFVEGVILRKALPIKPCGSVDVAGDVECAAAGAGSTVVLSVRFVMTRVTAGSGATVEASEAPLATAVVLLALYLARRAALLAARCFSIAQ